jgi:hypothetical protein
MESFITEVSHKHLYMLKDEFFKQSFPLPNGGYMLVRVEAVECNVPERVYAQIVLKEGLFNSRVFLFAGKRPQLEEWLAKQGIEFDAFEQLNVDVPFQVTGRALYMIGYLND